nr:hypothetical protein GCM10010200_048870 [Actinomadura rugatobispora]
MKSARARRPVMVWWRANRSPGTIGRVGSVGAVMVVSLNRSGVFGAELAEEVGGELVGHPQPGT